MGNSSDIDSTRMWVDNVACGWNGDTNIYINKYSDLDKIFKLPKNMNVEIICNMKLHDATHASKFVDFVLRHKGKMGIVAGYTNFHGNQALRLFKGLCGNKYIHKLVINNNGFNAIHHDKYIELITTAPNLGSVNYIKGGLFNRNYIKGNLVKRLSRSYHNDRLDIMKDENINKMNVEDRLKLSELFLEEHGFEGAMEYIEKREKAEKERRELQ